jgi:hypothetical protein
MMRDMEANEKSIRLPAIEDPQTGARIRHGWRIP